VTTVAHWCVTGFFTTTKECSPVFFSSVFHRLELRIFMRTIAKWLFGTLAAGTPEVVFSLFHINYHRLIVFFTHCGCSALSLWVSSYISSSSTWCGRLTGRFFRPNEFSCRDLANCHEPISTQRRLQKPARRRLFAR